MGNDINSAKQTTREIIEDVALRFTLVRKYFPNSLPPLTPDNVCSQTELKGKNCRQLKRIFREDGFFKEVISTPAPSPQPQSTLKFHKDWETSLPSTSLQGGPDLAMRCHQLITVSDAIVPESLIRTSAIHYITFDNQTHCSIGFSGIKGAWTVISQFWDNLIIKGFKDETGFTPLFKDHQQSFEIAPTIEEIAPNNIIPI